LAAITIYFRDPAAAPSDIRDTDTAIYPGTGDFEATAASGRVNGRLRRICNNENITFDFDKHHTDTSDIVFISGNRVIYQETVARRSGAYLVIFA
jgi:hypothetical protein